MRALIEAQTEALTALAGLLRAETERLACRDIDGLDRLLTDKLSALQEIERLERERQEAMRRAGFEPDPAGMQAYLERARDPELDRAWETLKARLAEVRFSNEANGSVIQRSLDQLQSQLALLRGEPADGAGVYGPGGSTQRAAGGREISRA